ncbi:hypothetical protein WMY93_025722 [Mugilogobius chulae]|uniref:RAD51 interacting motif domain-containing protein n=1 Tax=Mugilogobius chulae TaxID=88201 RepID=A0AAW0N067_9GOBI
MDRDRDRPSRKTKSVNYCESKDFEDDDEDFAFAKSPPLKKAKDTVKQQKLISSQESNSRSGTSQRSRKSVDVKILERDLEAAISLSLLNTSCETSNASSVLQGTIVQTSGDENTEPPCLSSHLSNCSVDTIRLGLDQITSDSNAPSKEMKDASKTQINKQKTQDDDYQPCVASESESDNDYSEHDSEDEEFTVKKAGKTKKEKQKNNGKAKPPPTKATKQDKQAKSKSAALTPTRTPLTLKNTSELSRSASSSKVSKHVTCQSPAASKVPKWNPPGQIGKSPSSNSPIVRSPGQGLRLGLSRLVRVKPLHPSVASH